MTECTTIAGTLAVLVFTKTIMGVKAPDKALRATLGCATVSGSRRGRARTDHARRDRSWASRLLTPGGSWTEANDEPDDPGERVERRGMTFPTIFDTCRLRADVLTGAITEADFAADLAQVILGEGNAEYLDPARFFANTYPTRGLKNLLANVCRRLTGAGGEVASIFRLDTTYGGGKSHGLIALCHAARSSRLPVAPAHSASLSRPPERGWPPDRPQMRLKVTMSRNQMKLRRFRQQRSTVNSRRSHRSLLAVGRVRSSRSTPRTQMQRATSAQAFESAVSPP